MPYPSIGDTPPGYRAILTPLLLHELFTPPEQSTLFERNLDTAFSSDRTEDKSILDDQKKAIKLLSSYRIFSKHTEESIDCLKESNKHFLKAVSDERANIRPIDEVTRRYCLEHGLNFEDVQHDQSVLDYCRLILPQPMNRSIKEEKERRFSIDPNNDKNKDFRIRRELRQRLLYVHFSDFRVALKQSRQFSVMLHGDVNMSLLNAEAINTKIGRKRKTKTARVAMNQTSSVLARCEFCYNFRFYDLKEKGTNKVGWHCERLDCSKAFSSWKKALNREPYSINLSVLS